MARALAFLAALLTAYSAQAETFRFQYHDGDQYRYYGSSTQKVYIDRQYYQSNLLSYRIAYSVSDVDAASGRLKGHITYITQSEGGPGAISQEYDTDYRMDTLGAYTVPADQVMPVVRNVPVFPDTDIQPGATWTGRGEEVHDLRDDFGVDRLLRVPFDVTYTYQGTTVRDGKTLHVIVSDYQLDQPTGFRYPKLKMYPLRMSGYSHQLHYFNLEKGREEGYEETYSLVLAMNTGQIVEYTGQGNSFLVEAHTMDKPAVADEVKKGLAEGGMGNVEVKTVPQGVTINLDNIQFPGDSADLVPSEQEKLRLIGDILKKYPDRDILVEGHTANVVGGLDPQSLSEARAAAVGDFLVKTGVREPQQITYKGWGATKPLAPNDTEEHRAKNRRVEITILEN